MMYAQNKQITPDKEEPQVRQPEALPELPVPVFAKPAAANEVLNISMLIERCQQEIQVYRRGDTPAEAYGLELLRRAIIQGDEDAWAGLRQCLWGIASGWLYSHPNRRPALRLESDANYVDLAFERFWQATVQRQMQFESFGGALAYLRACLNGALLDTLRTQLHPREVALPASGEAEEPCGEDHYESSDVWLTLQGMLPDPREQRLAYLLYHCGLKPREIVKFCPLEWDDVQEIYRVRRNIVDRLRRNADQLRWQLNREDSM